jgi:serine/threonine-protein kinase PRP4
LYAGQIFSALDLVHKLKYIHADLKPDNIMISDNTRSLKICDFGSSIGFNEVDLMKSA